LVLRSESSLVTDTVVEDVITALGPSVAEAVAQALRALQGQAQVDADRIEAERIETARLESVKLEAARVEAARLEASRVEALRIQAARDEASRLEAARIEAARLKSAKEAAIKATASLVAVQPQYPAAKPVYNFLYKVADDKEQTYISRNEERDGDNLEGTYSYVDANGALITVNYQAGAMGYSETREEQADFVKISSKPKAEVVEENSSSQIDQSSLIARILSVLKPQIGQVVLSTLSAQEEAESARIEAQRLEAQRLEALKIEAARVESGRLEATRIEATRIEVERQRAVRLEAQRQAAAESARLEAARVEAARIEAARLESVSTTSSRSRSGLFGDGQFNVKIQTPEFTVRY